MSSCAGSRLAEPIVTLRIDVAGGMSQLPGPGVVLI
jgi:hypothetical protein